MAFTVRDEPHVVRTIRRDLDHVVEAVRAHDRHLQALVLTGGFARGEGAFLDGRPQNDYDLVAIRGLAPTRGYDALRRRLEGDLGLHIDLAPVAAARLSRVPPSIFWYETALRGKVLWGPAEILTRIPVRSARMIPGTEAMRLLVNRAAGLLLATQGDDEMRLLQSCKAVLAALDARMLAHGMFLPSQRERWAVVQGMIDDCEAPLGWHELAELAGWAFAFKTDPGRARRPDPAMTWHAAARAVLDTVPAALDLAGAASLEAYARRDGALDRVAFMLRSGRVAGAKRLARHPTGQVRVAAIQMLQAEVEGRGAASAAPASLAGITRLEAGDRVGWVSHLEELRHATLQ